MREGVKDLLDADRPDEQSIWDLIIGPCAWVGHFTLSYATAAIVCAKTGEVAPARVAIAVYTAVALVIIGLAGLRAMRTWGERPWGSGALNRQALSQATGDDRRRFIGFAALLLCTISFIATLYGALPAAVFATCR